MKCRFINTDFMDGYSNMAIDEALLEHCKIPVLRIYGWKPRAITLGYNQDLSEINLEKCKELNVDVVRRITGGKAVFHDSELTYSFILPESSGLLPKEINESYKEIANALLIAFEKLGIKAEVKKVPERIATSICFNSSNWYELLVNGKKISGSAQRRMSEKILQHGSMLMDFDYEKNSILFNSINAMDSIHNLQKRITSLKNELNKTVNYKDFADAIKSGFKENFNFDMVDDSLTNEELKLAEKLRKEKYLTEEWNHKLVAKTI